MFNGIAKVVSTELGRSEWDERKVQTETFIDFSQDLAIWEATL